MKTILGLLVLHLSCVIIFFMIYSSIMDDFVSPFTTKKTDIVDCLLLSTTIQAGVGLTKIFPVGNYGRLIVILQQTILIASHVITIVLLSL